MYERKLILTVLVVFQELAFFKSTDTYKKGSSSIFFQENVFSNLLLTSKNNIEIQFHRLSFAATIIRKFLISMYHDVFIGILSDLEKNDFHANLMHYDNVDICPFFE